MRIDKKQIQFPSGDHKGDRRQNKGGEEPDTGNEKGEGKEKRKRRQENRDTVSINFLFDNQK